MCDDKEWIVSGRMKQVVNYMLSNASHYSLHRWGSIIIHLLSKWTHFPYHKCMYTWKKRKCLTIKTECYLNKSKQVKRNLRGTIARTNDLRCVHNILMTPSPILPLIVLLFVLWYSLLWLARLLIRVLFSDYSLKTRFSFDAARKFYY